MVKITGSYDETLKIWDIKTAECVATIDYIYDIAIDKDDYFVADDEAIEKYLRVSEAPLSQRPLTPEEIKHFRKKGNFLEIGRIIPKQEIEPIEIERDIYDDEDYR